MARRRREACTSNSNSRDGNVKPVQRNAANARERARMRVLSKAFSRLKTSLPWVPADTKLSKLDTLRLASSYISHLRKILDEEPDQADSLLHPLNLVRTWPFTFNLRASANDNQGDNSSSSSGSEECDQPSQESLDERRPIHHPVHHQQEPAIHAGLTDLYVSPSSPFSDYLHAFHDSYGPSNREGLHSTF